MFEVTVKFFRNYPSCNDVHSDSRKFFGAFAAVYMGKEYASCADVLSVDVVNMETGEILFYKTSAGEVYEAEY